MAVFVDGRQKYDFIEKGKIQSFHLNITDVDIFINNINAKLFPTSLPTIIRKITFDGIFC